MGSKYDHKVKLRLLFERDGTGHFVNAHTENISPDGVYVTTKRKPLALGTKVSILLEIPGRREELQIEGSVAWQGGGDPIDARAGSSGMGIAFEDMEDDTRETLYSVIEDFERDDGLGPVI